jgi:hypothetical protein
VESSANFRNWSIRYHSRSQTFTINERNSNNKFLKENFEKQRKYEHILDRWNGPNGPNGAEKCIPFSATQRPLDKGHPRRACCDASRECRLALECDEILKGGYFWHEFERDLIIAQR